MKMSKRFTQDTQLSKSSRICDIARTLLPPIVKGRTLESLSSQCVNTDSLDCAIAYLGEVHSLLKNPKASQADLFLALKGLDHALLEITEQGKAVASIKDPVLREGIKLYLSSLSLEIEIPRCQVHSIVLGSMQ